MGVLQNLLLNATVHVSYLLSPEPIIMAFASNNENRDPEDRLECELLIFKMFVSNHFFCNEKWEQYKARLIDSDKFSQEHNEFWSKQGFFKSRNTWITAENTDCIVHEWQQLLLKPIHWSTWQAGV